MAGNVVEILVKATDQTAAGFGEAKTGAEGTAASMDELAAAQDRATAAEDAFRAAQAQQNEALAAQRDLQQSGAASADELAAAQDRVTAAALASLDAQGKLAAADAEVVTAQKAQGDAAEESAAKTDASGGVMAGAGGKIKMAALGVAVGMGLAVKSAMDFQQQSTKWVTSAGESASQLGMLQQGVLALSAQTATSSEQLSNGLYMISSAGITGAGGLSVLKAAAEGAKSEGADLAEVTNALTSGINAYGMKTKTSAEATVSATSMMNQMLATVSAGKMTFQELAGSLSSVLPIAAANKISYAQVGGALATMTSMGVSARQGTQDLAATIRSLGNPTSVATNEMAEFGISSTDVSSKMGQRGLTGTIAYLSDAITSKMGPSGLVLVNSMNQSKAAAADATTMLGQLPPSIQGVAKAYLDGTASYQTWYSATKGMPLQAREMATQFAAVAGKAHGFNQLLASGSPAAQTYAAAMAKMLGGATGLNVGLMLTGTHAATFNKNVKSIAASADGASGQVSGFSDVTKTTAFQMAKAKDSIEAAGTELGLTLLPAVNAVLKPLASFLAMIASNKAAAIAFATVVGGLLAGAVGTRAVHALTDMKKAMQEVASGVESGIKMIGRLIGANDAQAASSKKTADAAKAAAGEEAAASQEAAAAAETAAGEEETAAAETATANEEAAATSSGSWITAAGQQIAAAAGWVAENTAKVASVVAENVAGAAATAGSWIAAGAGQVASAATWVAANVAKIAMVVAVNVAGALSAAAAWIAANALMTGGIILVVAAVAAAVYEIVRHWKTIVHGVEEAWDDVYRAVSKAVSTIVNFVKSHWELLLAILLGPIAVAVLEIARHWDTIKKDAEKFISAVLGDISRFAGDVLHFFERMFDDVVGTAARWYGDLISWVRRTFDDFISREVSGIENIVHWFEGLPGRIIGALGDLDTMLLGAGERIIKGLIHGVTNMVGDVGSTMSSIAGEITSHLPFSPAKKGPLSGSGSPDLRGRKIAQMLAQGLAAGMPDVTAAMNRLTGGALAPAGGSAAPAAGGVVQHQITVAIDASDSQIMTGLMRQVRAMGGDPNMFVRKVAYR
jgi:hypothetical protein